MKILNSRDFAKDVEAGFQHLLLRHFMRILALFEETNLLTKKAMSTFETANSSVIVITAILKFDYLLSIILQYLAIIFVTAY